LLIPRFSFSGVMLCAGIPSASFSGFYDAWKTAKAVPVGVRCLHPAEGGVNESTTINHLGLGQVLKN
ncbi:MAG TPA: hypothetical protein VL361_25780, partial [Candidatus Limnocylindrales bacterium]|nr:hypothetical protein [Candidatus Limnocylindrales bacterium]